MRFYYKNFASGFRKIQRQKTKGISGILFSIVISLILTSPSGFSNLPSRLWASDPSVETVR